MPLYCLGCYNRKNKEVNLEEVNRNYNIERCFYIADTDTMQILAYTPYELQQIKSQINIKIEGLYFNIYNRPYKWENQILSNAKGYADSLHITSEFKIVRFRYSLPIYIDESVILTHDETTCNEVYLKIINEKVDFQELLTYLGTFCAIKKLTLDLTNRSCFDFSGVAIKSISITNVDSTNTVFYLKYSNLNNIDFIVQSYNQIRTKVSEDTTIVLDCKSIILDDYTSSLLHDLRGDVIIISNTSSADCLFIRGFHCIGKLPFEDNYSSIVKQLVLRKRIGVPKKTSYYVVEM